MANPLLNSLGGNSGPSGMFQNLQNMMNQISQFSSMIQGDPKQMVMNLVSQGKMSNEQFNQLAQTAKQLEGMFNSGNK